MRFAIADSNKKCRRCSAACGLALFVLLARGQSASAQSSWNLTTSDFKTRVVNLVALNDNGARVTEQSPDAQSPDAPSAGSVVPWQQILQLERVTATLPTAPPANPDPANSDAAKFDAATPNTAKFALHLANGDRVVGEPQALEGETLGWISPAAGRVDVKLKQVTAITRAGQPAPRRDQQRTEDVVSLANGDATRGLISAIDPSGLTVQSDGNAIAVPWDAVRDVLLATLANANSVDSAVTNARGVRVTLADGSILSGAMITLAGDKAVLGAGDAMRDVAAAAVVSVEQVNGPVAWLSSLPPTESVQTPFLETIFPARMDRSVRGEPIRFGDRTFSRGIGVHAYSRVAWQLPDGNRYKSFRTQYAIDGDKPYANVTVRVKLDDKVVHETRDFVAGNLSDIVQIPLGSAKTLTLEVDYGKTYDVQDRFNWIEPALLAE